jgi:hypothetical protein
MMLAQVTLLAPGATDRSPLAARGRGGGDGSGGVAVLTERERPARESARELSGDHRHVALCSRWWHGSKDNSREVSGPL